MGSLDWKKVTNPSSVLMSRIGNDVGIKIMRTNRKTSIHGQLISRFHGLENPLRHQEKETSC
jgi:hypothetical protein